MAWQNVRMSESGFSDLGIFRKALIKFHQHWHGKRSEQDFQDFQDFQEGFDKISPTLAGKMEI